MPVMKMLREVSVLVTLVAGVAAHVSAQGYVTFTTTNYQTVTSASFHYDAYACTPSTLTNAYAQHEHSYGTDDIEFGSGSQTNCTWEEIATGWSGDVTLLPGTNYIWIFASDMYGTYWEYLTVTYNAPNLPKVAVGPDSSSAYMTGGVTTQHRFKIKSERENQHNFGLTVSCSGVVSCGGTQPTTLSLTGTDSAEVVVTYSVSGSTGAAGTLMLKAIETPDASNRDSAIVSIQVAPSGPVVDRSQCLTIAVAGGGAFECGDLRLSHALPAVRTINTTRAPVLTYSVQQAHPYPIIAMTATVPGGAATPDYVVTTVWINSTSVARTVAGSQFPAGVARRAMVAIDAINYSTGLYDYTIEVRSYTGANNAVLASGAGSIAIVNRKDSPFGAGWWVAGLEQLVAVSSTRMLWIGGDGSTRVYEQMGTVGSQSVFVAPLVSRADTLIKSTIDSTWVRKLTNGGTVGFDATLRHTTTANRLGHTTTFAYTGGSLLSSITVPPSSASLSYTFDYSSGKLSEVSVADSTTSVNRVVATAIDGYGRLTGIEDPGLPAVTFAYSGSTSRVAKRVDRRGGEVRFGLDSVFRLRSSAVALPGGDSSVVTFCAAESMGMTACQSAVVQPGDVRTILDGPRAVQDTTTFWPSQYGGPSKIRDGLGNETVIERGDAAFPALVTRLRTPDGHVMKASYDARGNIVEMLDSNLVVSGVTAKTKYSWHPKWAMPTKITAPAGDFTLLQYNDTSGNLVWQQDARGDSTRTNYSYDSLGRLAKSTRPGGGRDSLVYDTARWNVAATLTPLNRRTDFTTDRIGRPTLSRVVLAAGSPNRVRDDSVFYDRLGRVVRTVAFGDTLNDIGPQRVIVARTYDAEGSVLAATRFIKPIADGLDSLRISWAYDTAGRRVAEVSPDGAVDSTFYDKSGNAITVKTRRGHSITMEYDALNRLVKRVLPPVTYDSWRQGATLRDTLNTSKPAYGGFTIAGDTTTFAYDVMGRVIRAVNADARVIRTYTGFGALENDTLHVFTMARTDSLRYAIKNEYDINGRLKLVTYPAALVSGTNGTAQYFYHAQGGFLSEVRGVQNEQFTFDYDARGELVKVSKPGGIVERRTVDADGLLVTHSTKNDTPSGVEDRSTLAYFDSTAMTYDARGKLSSLKNKYMAKDTATYTYGGLGALRRNIFTANGFNILGNSFVASIDETYSTDALANVRSQTEVFSMSVGGGGGFLAGPGDSQSSSSSRSSTFAWNTGRQTSLGQVGGQTTFLYDSAGNTVLSTREIASGGSPVTYDDRVAYYNAAGVVRFSERKYHTRVPPGYGTLAWEESFLDRFIEEYRYDPLGRRILVWHKHDCLYAGNVFALACHNASIRRTVWHGDRELMEIQRPIENSLGGTLAEQESDTSLLSLPTKTAVGPPSYVTAWDPSILFGRVAYTYGPAIDQPLSITRLAYTDRNVSQSGAPIHRWPTFTLIPHWDVRGEATFGTFSNGAVRSDTTVSSVERAVQVTWPAGALAYGRLVSANLTGWHGTLMDQKMDQVGTLYRRNRYYDAATGRFTQPDPIGLAGGLNVYGFAGGDPINFSDPSGLCPKEKTGRSCLSPLDGARRVRERSEFGRNLYREKEYHLGTDRLADWGDPVYSVDEGKVVHVGQSTTWGTWVLVAHHDESGAAVSFSAYMHLAFTDSKLRVGGIIGARTRIGFVGTSGYNGCASASQRDCTPVHLHLELWKESAAGAKRGAAGIPARWDPEKHVP